MTRLLIIISNTYTTSIRILKQYDKYLGKIILFNYFIKDRLNKTYV